MGKSFRFLFRFVWINLSAILGFAAIIILGCYATGVPGNAHNGSLFETYYAMYPIMMLFMLYIYAFALCTSNLNLGLSFGARRRDFFWAVQGVMVCAAAICWALQLFVSAFPAIAGGGRCAAGGCCWRCLTAGPGFSLWAVLCSWCWDASAGC